MLGVLAGSSLAQSSSDGDHAQRLKFEIWQRGLPECGAHGCSADSATDLSALQQRWMYTRSMPIARLRGGSDGCAGTACEPDAVDLDQLRAELGPEFGAALERNVRDHEADCEASCEHFYCGQQGGSGAAPASPKRPPELLQAQAQLLNRAVVAQLPSGDPGADLMAQLPREARAAAPRYTPQGSAAQQASAPSSLDVLLSRNGLLQSEQGGLPQS